MIQFVHPSIEEYLARPAHPKRREGGRRLHGHAPAHTSSRKDSQDLPLVTIVTAVRNGERYLGRAIESVLAQTYPHIEYVIADAASTDNTLSVVERYQDRIDYWVSEPDRSMFDGMNRGLAVARGRYLKIHGCDDVMPEDSVEAAVATFRRAADQDQKIVVRGDMELVDSHENVIGVAGLSGNHKYSPAILHPTWYVPRRVYEQHGLYDPGSVVSSDYEMYFYLAQRGVTFHHADRVLTRFRTGGTSSTYAGFRDGFAINRRYQGLFVASYMFGLSSARLTTRRLLAKVVGDDRTNDLRRWLRAKKA